MVKTHMLASSVEDRPIHAYELENEAPAMLIFGGMHGDEPQSAFAAERIVELLSTRVGEMMDEHLIVVPRLNPDGLERGTRKNANGVDLNRNFPTANWVKVEPEDDYYGGQMAGSEPETQLELRVRERRDECEGRAAGRMAGEVGHPPPRPSQGRSLGGRGEEAPPCPPRGGRVGWPPPSRTPPSDPPSPRAAPFAPSCAIEFQGL